MILPRGAYCATARRRSRQYISCSAQVLLVVHSLHCVGALRPEWTCDVFPLQCVGQSNAIRRRNESNRRRVRPETGAMLQHAMARKCNYSPQSPFSVRVWTPVYGGEIVQCVAPAHALSNPLPARMQAFGKSSDISDLFQDCAHWLIILGIVEVTQRCIMGSAFLFD